MKLLIVESSVKARTIAKYLGQVWRVEATTGPVKDLQIDNPSLNLEGLRLSSAWVRKRRELFEKLKGLAQRATHIYIGTDPDREGEFQAYFIQRELEGLKKPISRVILYEITEDSLRQAVETPGAINLHMVEAHFAYKVLNNFISHRLLSYLQRALNKPYIAVESIHLPALYLIVERERQIQSFRKREYYYIKAIFEKEGIQFSALWDYRFEKAENARPYLEKLNRALFEVSYFSEKQKERTPPKPFTTSSLQYVAHKRLKMRLEKVQSIAQRLYEKGYITYPKTDSYSIEARKAREFIEYIKQNYGDRYAGKLRGSDKNSTAQFVRECIRPAGVTAPFLGGEELNLYELILHRTLASLSSPAYLLKREAVLKPLYKGKKGENIAFVVKGAELLFDGYLKIYPEELELFALPPLQKGELLRPKKVGLEKKEIQPPSRYTAGTLVKKLEELGVGRPSTYADTVRALREKGYAVEEEGYLRPTEIAFEVVDLLKEKFPELLNHGFIHRMLKGLEEVEKGKRKWRELVRELCSVFEVE